MKRKPELDDLVGGRPALLPIVLDFDDMLGNDALPSAPVAYARGAEPVPQLDNQRSPRETLDDRKRKDELAPP